MSDHDRKRLVAILGMLGSNSAGERAAAALQAEAFRRKHRLAWDQLISGSTIYVDREVYVETPIFVDRPMPALRSIAAVMAEPTPCVFVFTVAILTVIALIRTLVG